MSKITIAETEYKNYGRCLLISNNIVKLIITVDVGPRIINYSFIDGENIMFEDINRDFYEKESIKAFGDTWYIYGGHRLWTSPESMPRSYYPDNEPVKYEILADGVRLMPKPQKWNQYVYEIEVRLDENSTKVSLMHKVTNLAAWPVELAPWSLTVLSPGGKEFFPQPTRDTGVLGNRLIALWPYTKLTDPRLKLNDKFISLAQDASNHDEFKLGINSQHGYAMYFNHGDLFIKQFNAKENGNYPDGGMSFETFTNRFFLEMESLGEIVKLEPNASASHCETWTLHKEECPSDCDAEILNIAEKYFGK